MSSAVGGPQAGGGQAAGGRNPLQDALAQALGEAVRQALPQLVAGLVGALGGLLSGALGGIFRKQPPAAPAPAPPTVQSDSGPPLAQVPIVAPVLVTSSIRLVLQGMEKPARVGGGPGINYEDARGMSARGEAFNYECVGFFDATAFNQDGEWTGGLRGTLVQYDKEFRNRWNVYDAKTGNLVAFWQGEGDANPAGEGEPANYHGTDSEAPVHFGWSKWYSSAGFGQRLTFVDEGDFEVEFEFDGKVSNRVPVRVS
jgi:hypothetical protein